MRIQPGGTKKLGSYTKWDSIGACSGFDRDRVGGQGLGLESGMGSQKDLAGSQVDGDRQVVGLGPGPNWSGH